MPVMGGGRMRAAGGAKGTGRPGTGGTDDEPDKRAHTGVKLGARQQTGEGLGGVLPGGAAVVSAIAGSPRGASPLMPPGAAADWAVGGQERGKGPENPYDTLAPGEEAEAFVNEPDEYDGEDLERFAAESAVPLEALLKHLYFRRLSSQLYADFMKYIPFLIMFCFFFLGLPGTSAYRDVNQQYYIVGVIKDRLMGNFFPATHVEKYYVDSAKAQDWTWWASNIMVDNVWRCGEYDQSFDQLQAQGQNFMLGALRYRTLRTSPHSCEVNANLYANATKASEQVCYAAWEYDEGVEDTADLHGFPDPVHHTHWPDLVTPNTETADAVHMGEFWLWGPTGFINLSMATAFNAYGSNKHPMIPLGTDPQKAIDEANIPSASQDGGKTYWIDYDKGPLTVELFVPSPITAYTFRNAQGGRMRDATQWIIEGSNSMDTWYSTGNGIPEQILDERTWDYIPQGDLAVDGAVQPRWNLTGNNRVLHAWRYVRFTPTAFRTIETGGYHVNWGPKLFRGKDGRPPVAPYADATECPRPEGCTAKFGCAARNNNCPVQLAELRLRSYVPDDSYAPFPPTDGGKYSGAMGVGATGAVTGLAPAPFPTRYPTAPGTVPPVAAAAATGAPAPAPALDGNATAAPASDATDAPAAAAAATTAAPASRGRAARRLLQAADVPTGSPNNWTDAPYVPIIEDPTDYSKYNVSLPWRDNGPNAAIDGHWDTAWIDDQGRSLIVDFGTDKDNRVLKEFTWVTSSDKPWRDPVGWNLYAFTGTGSDDYMSPAAEWRLVDGGSFIYREEAGHSSNCHNGDGGWNDGDAAHLCQNVTVPLLRNTPLPWMQVNKDLMYGTAYKIDITQLRGYPPNDKLLYQHRTCVPKTAVERETDGFISGDIAKNYHCGGYEIIVPFNATCDTAKKVSWAIQSDNYAFVDNIATRFIVVEFFVYTPSEDVFTSVKLFSEVAPCGSWNNKWIIRTFSVFTKRQITSGQEIFNFFFLVFVLYFIMRYFMDWRKDVKLRRSIYRQGQDTDDESCGCCHPKIRPFGRWCGRCMTTAAYWHYPTEVWNVLEALNLTTFIVVFAFRYIWWGYSEKAVNITFPYGPYYPGELDRLSALFLAQQYANAINCIVTFLKFLKYVRLNSKLNLLTRTIDRSKDQLGACLFIFMYVVIAYTLAGYSLYGTNLADFRSPGWAMSYLSRLLFGDFDYLMMLEENRQLTFMYFWTLVILAFFILLQFIIAILGTNFSEISGDANNDVPFQEQMTRSWVNLKRMLSPTRIKHGMRLWAQGDARADVLDRCVISITEHWQLLRTCSECGIPVSCVCGGDTITNSLKVKDRCSECGAHPICASTGGEHPPYYYNIESRMVYREELRQYLGTRDYDLMRDGCTFIDDLWDEVLWDYADELRYDPETVEEETEALVEKCVKDHFVGSDGKPLGALSEVDAMDIKFRGFELQIQNLLSLLQSDRQAARPTTAGK